MSTKQWADLSSAQVEDAFQVRAQRDPKYALAWAVCRLANAQHRTAEALDALGFNLGNRKTGPGTTERIGMELKRIADALEKQALPARHGRGFLSGGGRVRGR